jgi:DNA adenine methylase
MKETVVEILRLNKIHQGHYCEPFAGGGGLALALLFEGDVAEIHLNDLDKSIWAFWHSALQYPDEIVSLIEKSPLTLQEWDKQRGILLNNDELDPISLGFAAFYLNRTNRSGVIKSAGVIGGRDQTGPYKMDCRFNRMELIRRIRRIARYNARIHLSRLDAEDFLEQLPSKLPPEALVFIDPPYFGKGKELYTSFYLPHDHQRLSEKILETPNPWIVTYDAAPQITQLYRARRQYHNPIQYSLNRKRKGEEVLIASKGLRLPKSLRLLRRDVDQKGNN